MALYDTYETPGQRVTRLRALVQRESNREKVLTMRSRVARRFSATPTPSARPMQPGGLPFRPGAPTPQDIPFVPPPQAVSPQQRFLNRGFNEFNQRYSEPLGLVGGRLSESVLPFAGPEGAVATHFGQKLGLVSQTSPLQSVQQLPGDLAASAQAITGGQGARERLQARAKTVGLGSQIIGGAVIDPLNYTPALLSKAPWLARAAEEGRAASRIGETVSGLRAEKNAVQDVLNIIDKGRLYKLGINAQDIDNPATLAAIREKAPDIAAKIDASAVSVTQYQASPDHFENARTKLIASLSQQRKNIAKTKPERAAERGQRLAASEGAYEKALSEGNSPREAMSIKRGVQAGELPSVKGVPTVLDEGEEAAILDRVKTHDFGRGTGADFERDRVRGALLSLSTGQPIQENEIVSMEKVLGPEFGKAIRKNAKKVGDGWQLPYELAVTPKAILSAFDMSYPLRQAAMLAPAHPVEFGKAWIPMVRSFASEDAAQALNRSLIEDSRLVKLADGSSITIGRARQDTGLLRTLDPGLSTSEEAFRSGLAERIPILGKVVRSSNRAFTAFGNKFRGDVFATIVEKWERQGTPITEERLQGLSQMLNRFTGRGTLGNDRLAQVLQATWWAPQTRIAPAQAVGQLFNLDGAIRAESWRNMAAFMGTGATILGAAKMAGLKVNVDPRSTDFGKIVVGNTHINIWGPSQVLVRTIARVASGQRLSPNLGVIPTSRVNELWTYFRSGLAPEWAAPLDAALGEDILGRPIKADIPTLKREIPNRLAPLAMQDMYDAIKEEGLLGVPIGAASFFGESVSTYKQQPRIQLSPEAKGKIPEEKLVAAENLLSLVKREAEKWHEAGIESTNTRLLLKVVAQRKGIDPDIIEIAYLLRPGSKTRDFLQGKIEAP